MTNIPPNGSSQNYGVQQGFAVPNNRSQNTQVVGSQQQGFFSMQQICGSQYLSIIDLLPESFMDPDPPASVDGYDLSSDGVELVKNLATEVTCKSSKGIQASAEQALHLKSAGRNVSVTFALNNESFTVLAENVRKVSNADIPVRIVAGDKAPRSVGRENGTIILKRLLSMLHAKVFHQVSDNFALKKVKLKVCYHDGSERQVINDKIRLSNKYECELHEVSMQLQPLERLCKNLEFVNDYLHSIRKKRTPIVCYAMIFATQEAYDLVSDRVKVMAGHAFHDQEAYLKKLKATLDQFDDVSVRLSFFGFTALHWRARSTLIKRCYAAL